MLYTLQQIKKGMVMGMVSYFSPRDGRESGYDKRMAEKALENAANETVEESSRKTYKKISAIAQNASNPEDADKIWDGQGREIVGSIKSNATIKQAVVDNTKTQTRQMPQFSDSAQTSIESQTIFNRPLKRGVPKGEDVKFLQQFLESNGYDPGGVDGIFGAGTERALKKYQRDRLGQSGDGVMDFNGATMRSIVGSGVSVSDAYVPTTRSGETYTNKDVIATKHLDKNTNTYSFGEMLSKLDRKGVNDLYSALTKTNSKGGIEASNVRRVLDKYGYDKNNVNFLWLGTDKGELENVINKLAEIKQKQESFNQKSFADKIKVMTDFDRDGSNSANLNFILSETGGAEFLASENNLEAFLKDIGYPGALAGFKKDMNENYYGTRHKFMKLAYDKYGDGKKYFVDSQYKSIGRRTIDKKYILSDQEFRHEFHIMLRKIDLQSFVTNIKENFTPNTRKHKGAKNFLDPNKDINTRFSGLVDIASHYPVLDQWLSQNKVNLSQSRKKEVIDTLSASARSGKDAYDGNMEKYNNSSTLNMLIKKDRDRRDAYKGQLGANLDREVEQYYSLLKSKIGSLTKGVYTSGSVAMDSVATLHVGGEGKRIRGVDIKMSNFDMISSGGRPLLVKVTSNPQALINTAIREIKKLKLSPAEKQAKIKALEGSTPYFYKDAYGFDDNVTFLNSQSGKMPINQITQATTVETIDKSESGNKGGVTTTPKVEQKEEKKKVATRPETEQRP